MKNLLTTSLLLLSAPAFSQKIAGLFQGTLFNDTLKTAQNYELALSEYRGRITGYSYTTFVMDDQYYYGIRRIKASIRKDELVVEDGEIIVNNFPSAPDKGVRRISVIPLNGQDSVTQLNGRWQTTRTREFYSVPGSIDLTRTNDSAHSDLIRHLGELNLLTPNAEVPVVTARVEKPRPLPVTTTKPASMAPLTPARRRPILQHRVEVQSDSLTLSFYDNGVVDGDSISVYLDGSPLISSVRLTAKAVKHVIAIPADRDVNIQLVAESLGTIPPNTGLLVVTDGDRSYQLSFSADLERNASIVFRKKKK